MPTYEKILAEQPYPLIFATISGAHLYGFDSVDSDVDLRGVHLLPAAEVTGLDTGPETLQDMTFRDGVEIDLVTHDLLKFCRLLLRHNGYVAEQLLSPLVVVTSDTHRELVSLAPKCLTRHHSHHYLGFSAKQWALFERTGELKPALYTLRTLLTGIHLMRSGEVIADLRLLGTEIPYVAELIAAKRAAEHGKLVGIVTPQQLSDDVQRLRAELTDAATSSTLPENPSARADLHRIILRERLR